MMNFLKQELYENGFSIFKNALSQELVSRLITATYKTMQEPKNATDLLSINKTGHVHKILYMFDKGEIFLETLVHPSILKILETVHPKFSVLVPTWEDMLIKVPYEGVPVTVHQDLALQSVNHDVFSLGIYLHDSSSNPVHYLPKSHHMGPLTKDEIYDVYEKNKENFVPMHAEAGDIVIHNVKTVHYSEENKTPQPRYTWYLEFRTLDQLYTDSPWDKDWILSRRAIWVSALKTYASDVDKWLRDGESLEKYSLPLPLRISHTNDRIHYDPANPYNHF